MVGCAQGTVAGKRERESSMNVLAEQITSRNYGRIRLESFSAKEHVQR